MAQSRGAGIGSRIRTSREFWFVLCNSVKVSDGMPLQMNFCGSCMPHPDEGGKKQDDKPSATRAVGLWTRWIEPATRWRGGVPVFFVKVCRVGSPIPRLPTMGTHWHGTGAWTFTDSELRIRSTKVCINSLQ